MRETIIFLLGMVVLQSLLFTLYLFKKGNNDCNTNILKTFTLIIGLHFANLILGRVMHNYPVYGLSWVFLSMYGPFIYLYVRSFVGNFSSKLYANFLVPLYPLVLLTATDLLHQESATDTYLDVWCSLPVYGSFLIYLLLSLYQIFASTRPVENIKMAQISRHLLLMSDHYTSYSTDFLRFRQY